jgi:multisubunit Na+/H+ antiporter MnhE subunit
MRRALGWVGWWALLAGFWLLLTDSVKPSELAAGALAATLATAAAGLVRRERLVVWRPRPGWLRGAGRPPLRMVLDIGPLANVLWRRVVLGRRVRGRFRAVRFTRTGKGAEDTAARVLAKGAGSLAPNTFVVGVDVDERVLLVHQLVATDDPRDVDPLGLR